ncbi:Uncharacterized protein dnl_09080 [Desulfonema limicola]|uniref:Actin-like protein N-terminal domain-containing protein n=1 Tax=Desulfonema limicola TaxID=45656 RepID=A0A975B4K9_9BACT|nr:ParM/StbA family protein [Desulfonema limicola]QTA78679.1 Uncharacterized protein dnl_09080 [Desulfonema limicola]
MKKIIAGMDIGFGQAKVCLKNGDESIKTICFPRIFAEAGRDNRGLNNHSVYGIEGERFYVGEEALAYQDSFIRRDFRDYVKDKTYWLCIGKALIDTGIFNGDDNIRINRLILGLAPGHFYPENISHMKKTALSGIEFSYNNKICRFSAKEVKILPQGSGAFFSETLTDKGLIQEKNGYKKLHGILDVGYRTTDFVLFEKGQFIGEKEELSEDTGMRTVLEKLQSHIRQKYDKEELEFLEPVLRGQPFEFRGKEYDLSDQVEKLILDHIYKRIEPEVLKRWEGRINRMKRIVICGGGAYFFKNAGDFLKLHKDQIVILPQPEISNAVGFLRFGLMQEKSDSLKRQKI